MDWKKYIIEQEGIPWDEESEKIELSANSLRVLTRRYLRKNLDGKVIESPAQMFRRVAYHVAKADEELGGDVEVTTEKFYDLLSHFRFVPNSPTFTGAGTPLGQLAACFTEDMRVVTDRGLKRIADLQVGDRVLTHKGRYRPVTETMQRHYTGDLYRIKVKLIGVTLKVTPEHPILTPHGWVEAQDLKVGDKVAVGVPNGRVPAPMFDLAQLAYADELEVQAEAEQVRVRRPNMPPLQSRALIKRVFDVDLPEPDERYIRPHIHREDENVFFEIERIETVPFSGTVYNCEVDEDHTYVTEGVVVHNCFVLPISDDMGKEPDGIFMTLRNAALIQQTGGGNGFSFSRLRPKGDKVSTSAGVASGPIGFLKVYDKAFGEIAQGGCLVPETLVFTDRGLLRLDEIVNSEQPGWQPHRLNIATDEGWRASPHGYNNGVKPVLRVRTSEGLEIVGTPNHKVKVMTSVGPVWRSLEALQPGDAILVKLGQHTGELQPLRHPQRDHGNQVMPEFPDVLTEELAFFIGYLVGDGFIARGEKDYRVGVSVAHSSYLLDEMELLVASLFGDQVRVHRQQKEGDASVTFIIDNRALKEFFLLNGVEKASSTEAFVPRIIRQSPLEVVAAFLRGLFEADGTLVHGYPQLVTTSERLAREVATLLIGLGAPVSISQQTQAEGRFGAAPRWRVQVVSHRGLKVWRSRVGYDPRSRFAALGTFEPDVQRESSYPLPVPEYWLNPVLDAITLPQVNSRGRGAGVKFRSTEPGLRRQLLRYLRGDRQLTLSAYERLMDAYQVFRNQAPDLDALWFVHVTGVEEAGERLTLDLEVEDNHTYLAWGLVTHNTRRGANMAVLRVDHPDIEEFIRSKEKEGELTNFNISVGITDAFMKAVEEDGEFELVNPRDGKVWRKVRARDLFEEIVRHAHHNGEPGALFLDTANRTNPLPHLYELEATNPCGEQFLGPYENCCLGSINLAKHMKVEDGRRVVDWEKLRETTELAVHFLDNVVTANAYVPAVPQLREAALKARRIGLGIMGLADLMYDLGIRYGSEEGQEFAAQVMGFVRYHAMRKSIELARERGPFPAIKGSIYDPEDLKWQPPKPLKPYTRDWGRPQLEWGEIVEGIKRHGIRNAAQTTIAPTGTIATVSGCEGYGCEPVFALAYIRHFKDGDRDVELEYVSPRFMRALEEAELDEESKRRIIDEVLLKGSCQHIDELPEHIRHTFVVAQDISAEEHVYMQAALQAFVDNSISKCVVGDTLVLTERGLVPIQMMGKLRLPDQFAPLNERIISPEGEELADSFYYGGYRETRKVTLEYGFEIEGTPNHRVHVLTDQGMVEFRRLDELQVGDTVVLYAGQRRFGRPGGELPSFSGAFRTNSHHITFPTRMSKELAFFLGALSAEGAITINGINISNTDRELLEELRQIAQTLWGLPGYIARDNRNNVHYLQLNSRALRHRLLTDLGLEAGAENKVIPPSILQASEEEIRFFLRGLFLDGFMTQNGKLFGITLASKRLIHQLQILLLNFGVLGTVRKTGERAWSLTVQGGELERLAEVIGFVEIWKNERLARRNVGRLQRYRNYSRLLPRQITEALREMVAEATSSLRSHYDMTIPEETRVYQRIRVNLLQSHRLERSDARRLYESLRAEGVRHPLAGNFFEQDSERKVYIRVESIEAGFSEVFDISVPGSHSFIANGLGNHNTINFPEGATVEDVRNAYVLAWKLGCKGITVYVTGSREEVVLETRETKVKKEGGLPVTSHEVNSNGQEAELQNIPGNGYGWTGGVGDVRPRPTILTGKTYRRPTPVGTAWITVNSDEYGEPFEVFLNVGKAGSDVAADSEALGRLISLILRLPSPLSPKERMRQIIHQLSGIGGGRTMGFGPKRVRSLPDAIAQVLQQYLEGEETVVASPQQLAFTLKMEKERAEAKEKAESVSLDEAEFGDICPECGLATLIPYEGCKRCTNCGYSEC